MNTLPNEDLVLSVNQVYTPSFPIEIKQLFSGRGEQLIKVMSIIKQKGLHAIIYGDRGVGKTSFSNIMKILCESENNQVVKISCDSKDTFESVWRKILSKFSLKLQIVQDNSIGFLASEQVSENTISVYDLVKKNGLTLEAILTGISQLQESVVIIDEFDRLDDGVFDKRLLADLIKAISDTLPQFKIILVAVSEDVNTLIKGHESIERNISQIHMPTMDSAEIKEIILKGEPRLHIKFDDDVIEEIINLSSGFPHFTHSLCLYAVNIALEAGERSINKDHLQYAVNQTIDQAQESLREAYMTATLAVKQNIFKKVLFAASQVKTDEYGYFQANDLTSTLSTILKRPVLVTNFTSHLGKFCSVERGQILKVSGSTNRKKYKFKNPLMKAFVKINIVKEKGTLSL